MTELLKILTHSFSPKQINPESQAAEPRQGLKLFQGNYFIFWQYEFS